MTSSLSTLTARQSEIAQLVASAKTNREIADALFLSERTVEAHVAAIFNKLGVRSRVELATALRQTPETPPSNGASGQPWLVPDAMRTRYFTGREELLALLGSQLAERHRAALSGLGGVGKTQAAIEYALRHRADYPDGVFWVNAETTGGLTAGFVQVAQTLHLSTAASRDQEHIVKSVLKWLGGTGRWLLILDNVEDRREITPFVPNGTKGDVLITSRESVFQELGIARGLDVVDLDSDEALQFLLRRTGRNEVDPRERSAAVDLASELGNLPLALEQAAAYITETGAAFSVYLNAFRKRRITLLEKAGDLVARDTVAVTWAANFEAVERVSPAAADVLRTSAFLAADAIPFDLFLDGARVLGANLSEALCDPDDLALAEVLRPLARYSLIRSDATARSFGVHRLVQEVVRTALVEPERTTYVQRAVRSLEVSLPEVDFENWPRCEQLVPHVAAIAGWVDAEFGRSEGFDRVLHSVCYYLEKRGRFAEAQPLAERALAIRENALGPEHPDVAASLNTLSKVHYYQDHYTEAQPLATRALAIRENVLGPDHRDVADSLTNLANVYFGQRRDAEALPLYERSLAIYEKTLGAGHPDVAMGLNNLANLYDAQGRYAEALLLNERALAIFETALGPDHPDVGWSLSLLADRFRAQGRYAEALPLNERGLAILEKALGPDHNHVADALIVFAKLYVAQQRWLEAQPLYERALAIDEKARGPTSDCVAEDLTGLANLHVAAQRWAEAEPLLERALRILETAYGRDHRLNANTLLGLAALREKQGRTAEAIALYERALAIKERAFAADHPEATEIRSTLSALRATMTERAASGFATAPLSRDASKSS